MATKKSALLIIFLTIFIDLLGFGIIIPIIPFYLEGFLGDADFIGRNMAAMITLYSLMQFLFAPFWGRLSDRIGRRPIIMISLIGTAVTHVWFALSTELWMLYASRIFTGIFAATIPTANAYISDVTTPENRAKGMGLVGAAFGLGFILGPAMGGILSHLGGYRLPLLVAGSLSLAAFVLSVFMLPESRGKEAQSNYERFKINFIFNALRHPRLGLLFAIFFIVTMSFSNFETIFALYAEERFQFDALQVGYVFAFVGVCSALMQGVFIGRLNQRFGEKNLIASATLLLATVFIVMPFLVNIPVFVGAAGIMAISLGMHNPSVLALVSKNASDNESGAILGINHSFSALGRILGPLWAGFFFDKVSPEFPLISAGLLIAVAFAMSLLLRKKENLVEKVNR